MPKTRFVVPPLRGPGTWRCALYYLPVAVEQEQWTVYFIAFYFYTLINNY